MKYLDKIVLLLLLFASVSSVYGQPANADTMRDARIAYKLVQLVSVDPTYAEEVDISVGKMPLSDMLRNIAMVSKVNLSVKGAENTMVTCNFSRARITDLIMFLCREYDLDIDVVGNIVAIRPMPPAAVKPKEPQVKYAVAGSKLSYDLGGDKLIDVAKKITSLTGTNIVVPQPLYTRQVSGFVENMPFEEALQTLAQVNGLAMEKTSTGVWDISAPYEPAGQGGGTVGSPQQYTRRQAFGPNQLAVDSLGMITAQIGRGNIRDIITDLCDQQGFNYFFVSPVDQQTAIFVKEVDFETLLAVLLSGTQYSWYRENGIYVFGASSRESGMFSVRVIPLNSRSVTKIDELIPENLKTGLQIKQFADLNSIVASGDQKAVARVETFIRSIDVRVPQVTIEVMIVEAKKSRIQESGINMGLGNAPQKTSGSISGSSGIDMTLNSASVNNLINSFNGFGSVNLGKVSGDFYMSLKFLEDNGVVELRSTPKLSTLNGHEATLTSGQMQYYKETTTTWMSSNNPVQDKSYVWRSVEANMSVKITPFVSQDSHITLDIEIEQTEFMPRADDETPPGTNTRSFKSLIRVQNEEMVLLGGIDRNQHEKSSGGVPFIARVPVLKWFFGGSKNNKEEHLLNVFIKPTIID